MYFRVNESPTMGRCSLTQDDGLSVAVEMTSQFRVFCTDWVDVVSAKNNFVTNRCVFLRRVQCTYYFWYFLRVKRVRPGFSGWSNTIVSGRTFHALYIIPWIHYLRSWVNFNCVVFRMRLYTIKSRTRRHCPNRPVLYTAALTTLSLLLFPRATSRTIIQLPCRSVLRTQLALVQTCVRWTLLSYLLLLPPPLTMMAQLKWNCE